MTQGKKAKAVTSMLATTCTLAMFASSAQADSMTVATFGGGQGDAASVAFAAPFQEETGTEITVTTTENNIGALRAIASTSPAKWDVVDVAMSIAGQACAEGILLPLDISKLPVDDLAEGALSECAISIPKAATVMVYNNATFGEAGPQSWADFWDLEKFQGKRAIPRYISEATIVALLADGVAPADVSDALREPGARDRVFAKLDEIRDEIVWVATGTELVQGLVSGSFDMAAAWNARVETANAETDDRFTMVWGAGFNLDGAGSAIPATAADPEKSMDYIAFTVRPDRQAEYMENFPYGSMNTKSYEFVSEDLQSRLPTSPDKLDQAVVADVAFWADNFSDWQQAFEAWIAQ